MNQNQATLKPPHPTEPKSTQPNMSNISSETIDRESREMSNITTGEERKEGDVSNFQSIGQSDKKEGKVSNFEVLEQGNRKGNVSNITISGSDMEVYEAKEGIIPFVREIENMSSFPGSEKDSSGVISSNVVDPASRESDCVVKKYLVGLDGSEESSWAFNAAVVQMDRSKDMLYLLSISGRDINEEKVSKKILLHYAQIAEKHRVLNVKLMLGLYKNVHQAITQIVNDLEINFLFLGHKRNNTNIFQRLVNPSITKHCLATVECSVTITQTPVEGPDQHQIHVENIPEDAITEMIQKKLTVNDKTYLVDVLME
jgi:hypothetical protein